MSIEQMMKVYDQIVTPYKRHTLYRSKDSNRSGQFQRQPLFESVWTFTQSIVPKIQGSIERRLLDEYLANQTNAAYTQEIRDAYRQRMYVLKRIGPKRPPKPLPNDEPPQYSEVGVFNSLDGRGLKYHTYNDIGTYTGFPHEVFRTLFPYDLFGDYWNSEYVYTRNFALMCREEGLKLAAEFSNRTLPSERKLIDYKKLIRECASDMRSKKLIGLIKNVDYYKDFYYDFCLDMIDIYRDIKYKDPQIRQIMESAPIFDGIVSILIRELRKNIIRLFLLHKESRKIIMRDFLNEIRKEVLKENLVPMSLSEILITLHTAQVTLDVSKLKDVLKAEEIPKNLPSTYTILLKQYHALNQQMWRPSELRKYSFPHFKGFNTGALLWGPRGVGKSQILAYLGAWSYDNNWATILVPSGSKLVKGEGRVVQHSCGLYMQPPFAQQILTGIQRANKDIFANHPVNMNLYGKFNLAGWHDNDPPPIIREYDPQRKIWSDNWKKFLSEEQHKIIAIGKMKYDVKVTKHLPNPKNLLEIADYGVANPDFATACIAEILEQLYNTDRCNVLIASDDYNEWFDPSWYKSYQYSFRKSYKECIPPYDIALVRMFMRFDGHLMRNGVKVAATTQKDYFNHICTPDKIHFPRGYEVEVSPLALNDFRNACKYYNVARWTFKMFQEWEAESYYTLSQGNWYHFQHSIKGTTLLKH